MPSMNSEYIEGAKPKKYKQGGKLAIPGLKDHIKGIMTKMMKMGKGTKGTSAPFHAKPRKKPSLKDDILGQQDKTGSSLTMSGRSIGSIGGK